MSDSDTVYPYTELVMPVGTTITVTNENGKASVVAVSPLHRRYRWRDRVATSGLRSRTFRFYGSLGAYKVNAEFIGFLWLEQAQLSEFQIHFADAKDAQPWLAGSRGPPRHAVWNDAGLVADYSEDDGQLTIDVVQVCIAGKKPTHLSGARNEDVSIVGADGKPGSTLPCRNPGRVDNSPG